MPTALRARSRDGSWRIDKRTPQARPVRELQRERNLACEALGEGEVVSGRMVFLIYLNHKQYSSRYEDENGD